MGIRSGMIVIVCLLLCIFIFFFCSVWIIIGKNLWVVCLWIISFLVELYIVGWDVFVLMIILVVMLLLYFLLI